MKQTTKTLVGLLVLLLLAGGIAGLALWAGKDEQKKAEAKEKSEKLFDFDKAHVKELRLSKEGQLAMRLTKSEKAWKLVQPVEAEGDVLLGRRLAHGVLIIADELEAQHGPGPSIGAPKDKPP